MWINICRIRKGLCCLPNKPKYHLGILILIAVIFIYGVVHLLNLRFESGDVYPAYSSLRSDPLGTRVLFESLDNINPSHIKRNYLPLSQTNYQQPTTLLYLGSGLFDSKSIAKEFSDAIDRLTDAGGRLVMAFRPVRSMDRQDASCSESESSPEKIKRENNPETDKTSNQGAAEKPADTDTASRQKPEDEKVVDQNNDCPATGCRNISVEDYWGVRFKYDQLGRKHNYATVVPVSDTTGLPSKISWHTDLVFEKVSGGWKVLYRRDGHPVIIERAFNQGTIVLAADAYLFSNEALRKERHPALLARIIGADRDIVFDEGHFGIYKIPGLVELIRAHGLHWFFIGIGILFALFIWKNSSHFVPPIDEIPGEASAGGQQGRDYFQGLISLLRRNIPPKDLLKVGMNEWKKSFVVEKKLQTEQLTDIISAIDMEEAVSDNPANPVKGFITISRILSEGKKNE